MKTIRKYISFVNRLRKSNREKLSIPGFEDLKMSPFSLSILGSGPAFVNLVLPSVNPSRIFGGIRTAVLMALQSFRFGINLRIYNAGGQPLVKKEVEFFRDYLKREFSFARDKIDSIKFVDAREGQPIDPESIGEKDIFIATLWWTAWRISKTLADDKFHRKKFIYLIQDFEPGFYPWSDNYALAFASYYLDYHPILNTYFLAEYWSKSTGLSYNKKLVMAPQVELKRFQNKKKRENNDLLRIFFYGRPKHPRNLFGIGITALKLWIVQNNITKNDVTVCSAGSYHPEIELGNGIILKSNGHMDMEHYVQFLQNIDIGIALMLSPHPSYPPFEIAASGAIAVTNNFVNKSLTGYSNIVCVDPDPVSLVSGINEAVERTRRLGIQSGPTKLDISGLGNPLETVVETIFSIYESEP